MILSLLEQFFLYVPLMLGAYISISLMKIPNLSIESAYVFGAILPAVLLQGGGSGIEMILLVFCASLCGGAIVGIVSAFFSELAKFSYILSAIITIGLFHGLAQLVAGGSHITLSGGYDPLGSFYNIAQHPHLVGMGILVIIVVGLIYLFLQTELGLCCAIFGDNKYFLKNYRIDQSYVVISGLGLSNALAGLSGYMVAQSNGFADLTMGVGLPLLCLSSLIIGRSILVSSRPLQILVPLAGLLGYIVIQVGLLRVGFDLRYFSTVQASIVAILLLASSRIFNQSASKDVLGI